MCVYKHTGGGHRKVQESLKLESQMVAAAAQVMGIVPGLSKQQLFVITELACQLLLMPLGIFLHAFY